MSFINFTIVQSVTDSTPPLYLGVTAYAQEATLEVAMDVLRSLIHTSLSIDDYLQEPYETGLLMNTLLVRFLDHGIPSESGFRAFAHESLASAYRDGEDDSNGTLILDMHHEKVILFDCGGTEKTEEFPLTTDGVEDAWNRLYERLPEHERVYVLPLSMSSPYGLVTD